MRQMDPTAVRDKRWCLQLIIVGPGLLTSLSGKKGCGKCYTSMQKPLHQVRHTPKLHELYAARRRGTKRTFTSFEYQGRYYCWVFRQDYAKNEQHNETMAQKWWVERYKIAFAGITYAEAKQEYRRVIFHTIAGIQVSSKEQIHFTTRTPGRTSLMLNRNNSIFSRNKKSDSF